MIVDVKLFGHLAEACGPGPYTFECATAAEVFCALRSQIGGLKEHLLANPSPGYYVIVNGRTQTYEMLQLLLPDTGEPVEMKVVPAVAGSGDGKGIGMLIGGILLAIVSVGIGVAFKAGYVAAIGASIGLGVAGNGVAQLLSQQPQTQQVAQREAERKRQYKFDSLSPTNMQGVPIPVRFGRQCVEGYPVSIKMVVEFDAG